MLDTIKIYLSSTKYHWWNLISKNWKKNLIDEFIKCDIKNVEFIDPLVFESNDPVVCKLDIKDIRRSDYVVVYLDKITIGTMLELGYCLFNKVAKGKYFILSYNKNVVDHPWIQCLCKDKICESTLECVQKIYSDWNLKWQSKNKTI